MTRRIAAAVVSSIPKLLLGSCERQAQDEARSRDQTASEQAGYFTRAQALGRGFTAPLITRHARTGRFLRIDRGLYRLRERFHGGACRVGLRIAGSHLTVHSHAPTLAW
jgi:hypothetical protein